MSRFMHRTGPRQHCLCAVDVSPRGVDSISRYSAVASWLLSPGAMKNRTAAEMNNQRRQQFFMIDAPEGLRDTSLKHFFLA